EHIRPLPGPNIYLDRPVLRARIELEDLTERESHQFPGFVNRLLARVPGLRGHHCAKGEPGGFVERLYGGTYFSLTVEHVALELSTRAVVEAAERRGIPWVLLNDANLVQLGQGVRRRLIQAAASSLTSNIAVEIAGDKALTKKLLDDALLPVPRGVVVRTREE